MSTSRIAKRLGLVVCLVAATVAVSVAALALSSGAQASSRLLVGIIDDAQIKASDQSTRDAAWSTLGELRPEIIRVFLHWNEVAPTQPSNPRDPAAYQWGIYDDIVNRANATGIKVLFSIVSTPAWANAGRGPKYQPSPITHLVDFAYAAAKHYSGVRRWTAWNEPNRRVWLRPVSFAPGRYLQALAATYARICNATWRGVHQAGTELGIVEKVACGVTAPARRSAMDPGPISFLRAIKARGARFDVYAHNPYSLSKLESPSTKPRISSAVTLGNLGVLTRVLTRLYGAKRLWLTEYGYQTNPPEPAGVTGATQRRWLRQAYAMARRNPRVDMLVWFLFRDEPDYNGPARGVPGWQSGFVQANGITRKPAFAAYRDMPR
jgi:hypothetical protein